MPRRRPSSEQLRAQIEAAAAQHFPTEPIEERIAASLVSTGLFQEKIGSRDVAFILRGVVYTMFAQQKVAGIDVSLLHNIPKMKVNINDSQADVSFVVHIHKPIVAFLKFSYSLVNDPAAEGQRLCVKNGTLAINERTRPLDVKAKAALAAINVERITRKELGDLTSIIVRTLPPQLKRNGVEGTLSSVDLELQGHSLAIRLQGEFWPWTGASD